MIVAVDGKPLTREHDLADEISLQRRARACGSTISATATAAPSTVSSARVRRARARERVRELVRELALALRERVLPQLGSHAGRAHAGARPRRRRDLRDRRGGRGAARRVPRASARPTWRSTPRTAAWSCRAAAPHTVLVVDPIDGTRPALAGLESCCVSVAAAPLGGGVTMGDVTVGCVVEIPSGRVFLAERGAGVVEGPPAAVRERADRADVLDVRLSRPARRGRWRRCSAT